MKFSPERKIFIGLSVVIVIFTISEMFNFRKDRCLTSVAKLNSSTEAIFCSIKQNPSVWLYLQAYVTDEISYRIHIVKKSTKKCCKMPAKTLKPLLNAGKNATLYSFCYVNIYEIHAVIALGKEWISLPGYRLNYSCKKEILKLKSESKRKDKTEIFLGKDIRLGYHSKYAHELSGVFQRLHNSNDLKVPELSWQWFTFTKLVRIFGGHTGAKATPSIRYTFHFGLPE